MVKQSCHFSSVQVLLPPTHTKPRKLQNKIAESSADGSDAAPKRAYFRATPRQRQDAIIAFLLSQQDKAKTQVTLARVWLKDLGESASECARKAARNVKAWLDSWMETEGLSGAPHPGPTPKVPTNRAEELGLLMMNGKVYDIFKAGAERRTVRIYYPSWAAAFHGMPELDAACEEFNCTRDTLKAAILNACPALVYAPLHVRPGLSAEHITRRRECAQELAALPPEFWQRVVFVDETKIVLLGNSPTDVKVWRDAAGPDSDAVLHVGGVGAKPRRICLYAAVNAQLGLVAFQFTTGTTDLGEGWDREPIKDVDTADAGYMVGAACGF